ncbi:hypothetical protein C0J52_23696 [Blattella germanica]|nr:hypothetical protein C0J52_23696 [Blattella germanica]
MLLPSTPPCEELLRELRRKRDYISESFYATDAMLNKDWMRADYDLRHVVTRFAIHGFHHRICIKPARTVYVYFVRTNVIRTT